MKNKFLRSKLDEHGVSYLVNRDKIIMATFEADDTKPILTFEMEGIEEFSFEGDVALDMLRQLEAAE